MRLCCSTKLLLFCYFADFNTRAALIPNESEWSKSKDIGKWRGTNQNEKKEKGKNEEKSKDHSHQPEISRKNHDSRYIGKTSKGSTDCSTTCVKFPGKIWSPSLNLNGARNLDFSERITLI